MTSITKRIRKKEGDHMNKGIINNEINRILQSGGNTEKIDVSPFFTTCVMGKIEQLEDRNVFNFSTYILKPAFILLLLVNVVNFYFFGIRDSNESTESVDIELVATDYMYASNDFILNEDLISQSVD